MLCKLVCQQQRKFLRKLVGMASVYKIKECDQDDAIVNAATVLCGGGVVALPTDTIYGIAASVTSTEAIERLYDIKGRDRSKPIAICVSDVEHIHKWAKVTVCDELLKELFPGPVTAVFERKELLNQKLNPDTSLIGIRIPDYAVIRKLVGVCGFPLALTSANVSSSKSTLDVEEFKELWPLLDLILDGGRIVEEETTDSRKGSTVVNLAKQGTFSIIREGSSHQHIVHVLKDKFNLMETF